MTPIHYCFLALGLGLAFATHLSVPEANAASARTTAIQSLLSCDSAVAAQPQLVSAGRQTLESRARDERAA